MAAVVNFVSLDKIHVFEFLNVRDQTRVRVCSTAVNISLLQATWRRLGRDEGFVAFMWLDNAGEGYPYWQRFPKGYVVRSEVFLRGHENCGCFLSKSPETVYWWREHPPNFVQPPRDEDGCITDATTSHVIADLRKELTAIPEMSPGFIVKIWDHVIGEGYCTGRSLSRFRAPQLSWYSVFDAHFQ